MILRTNSKTNTKTHHRFCRTLYLLAALLLFLGAAVLCPAGRAEAAEVNIYISLSGDTVAVGETVQVTVSARGDSFTNLKVSMSYASDVFQLTSGAGGNGSVSFTFTSAGSQTASFKALKAGSGRFSTSDSGATDADGNSLSVAHAGVTVNVTGTGTAVTEKKTEASTEKKETTEKKEDPEGATEKTSEETTEEGFDEGVTAEVNGVAYNVILPAEELVPEGYTLTSGTYKSKKVPVYVSPNEVVSILALQMTEDKIGWFRLQSGDTLVPYVEYSSAPVRYVILDRPENVPIPEGYSEDKDDLGYGEVKVYRNPDIPDQVLVYAVPTNGNEGFYVFDTVDRIYFRYTRPEGGSAVDDKKKEQASTEQSTQPAPKPTDDVVRPSKEKDDGIFTKSNLITMLIGALSLFVIMSIVALVFMVKNSKLQNMLADEEEYDYDLPIRDASRREEYIPEKKRWKEEKKEEKEEKKKAKQDKKLDKKNKKNKKNKKGKNDLQEEEQSSAAEGSTEVPAAEKVTGDTIEIILEEAKDNNQSVHVTPVEDRKVDKVQDAMKNRPHGIDSAFDVIEEETAPEQAKTQAEMQAEIQAEIQEAVDRTDESHVKSEESQGPESKPENE